MTHSFPTRRSSDLQWQMGERDWTWIAKDPAPTTGKPVGGAGVAQLSPDTFVVAGRDIRLRFGPATPDDHAMMIRAEQGHYVAQGHWVRSAERGVGNEGDSTFRSRWFVSH